MKFFVLLFALLIAFVSVSFSQEDTCKIEVVKRIHTVYPPEAMKNKIEGTVYVDITISKDGLVETAMVSKTDNEILNEAALDAVVRWKFKPALHVHKATIPFKFKLSG
jgi:TonB family protein